MFRASSGSADAAQSTFSLQHSPTMVLTGPLLLLLVMLLVLECALLPLMLCPAHPPDHHRCCQRAACLCTPLGCSADACLCWCVSR